MLHTVTIPRNWRLAGFVGIPNRVQNAPLSPV
jgi:hypothetical protein